MKFSLRNLFGLGALRGAPPYRETEAAQHRFSEAETRQTIEFMSELGTAMNAAGDPTTFVRRSLNRVGFAYGLGNLVVFALPTLLIIRYGNDRTSVIDLSGQPSMDLLLDQSTELHRLVEDAERGRVTPDEGVRRLRSILAMEARFPFVVRIGGAGLGAAGISLILDPSVEELAFCLFLGVLVGVIEEGGSRWSSVWPLVPAAAGLIVGVIAFLLIDEGLESSALRIVLPPLATFLPGATLTVAMIELANGDIVAGSSRLAYGSVRLVLLVFGVVVAAQWVGVSTPAGGQEPLPLSDLLPLAGVLSFTWGVYLQYSAPRASFGWLLVVVLAAFLGEQFGSLFFAGHLSGLFGGVAMILAAQIIQVHPGAPPLVASVTPAFWFLAPGALGAEGITELAQEEAVAGISDLVAMILTLISIALGVLLGLVVSGSTHARDPRIAPS